MTSATEIPARPSSEARPVIAAAWMMGAVASFTFMAVAGRAVSLELDTFEVLGWRSLMGVIVMALVITFSGLWKTVNLHRFDLHLSRNIFHFAAQNLWFYAIFTIPLAQVFALEFTAPLWALILSRAFLGERLSTPRIVAALLGFIGILLVTRPGSVPITPGLISAACCAIGFAMTYVFTKKLTTVAHTASILFWMTVLQAVFGFICAGIDGDIALPSLAAAPWVAVIGVTGLTAHFCITCALRVAPATLVMPFDFLRLPVIALVGLLLFDEPVSLFLIAGAALILGGNYVNIKSAAGRSS
ncbi:DMT family transporter [Paracoccus onubensis]|uniref:DMT family transporter n=1 Tax=Paracoccus onubensis TaxID=1675788 RepID=UPI0027307606|nr:DMT family transporter [Paracoccus onubensis]MDP0927599.1 DMT family transporter [Paracoccus onubensis]